MSSSIIWLSIGIIFILLEILQVPGLGLLFLGLGSLSVAILLSYYDLGGYAFPLFGIISLLWFILLFKPMKYFLQNPSDKTSRVEDILGSIVEVYEIPLTYQGVGRVKWSGTIMRAQLASNEKDHKILKVGDKLIVKEVKGNLLICKPYSDL